MDEQHSMARLVRELRKLTGLTQEKFAVRLGVTFPTINSWGNNRARPSPLALEKIESLIRSLGGEGRSPAQRVFWKGSVSVAQLEHIEAKLPDSTALDKIKANNHSLTPYRHVNSAPEEEN